MIYCYHISFKTKTSKNLFFYRKCYILVAIVKYSMSFLWKWRKLYNNKYWIINDGYSTAFLQPLIIGSHNLYVPTPQNSSVNYIIYIAGRETKRSRNFSLIFCRRHCMKSAEYECKGIYRREGDAVGSNWNDDNLLEYASYKSYKNCVNKKKQVIMSSLNIFIRIQKTKWQCLSLSMNKYFICVLHL